MNLPVYLAGLVLASLLASVCLVAILIYFNPFSSDSSVFILFYLTLFISTAGFFTLTGWLIRRFSFKRKIQLSTNRLIHYLEISFRQGLFLAVILIAVLILQSQRILAWWYLLILVSIVGSAEWWLARK
ncbi:MAG: hypothetical protein CMI55_03800 [Parcubacteria group bacterium]|jgi:hypothetical protein|nr:hypothetical protein [Parcubacteria group bacterium]|tara:strand:- start:5547 stop:5933 length:387 start_codon:yes stop_codon:yes gene_type:complete